MKTYIKPCFWEVTIEVSPLMTGSNILGRGEDYTSGNVGGDAAQRRNSDWSDYESN